MENTTNPTKSTLTAILPDGTVATRGTARTYSHVLVGATSKEYNVRTAQALLMRGLQDRDRLADLIAGTVEPTERERQQESTWEDNFRVVQGRIVAWQKALDEALAIDGDVQWDAFAWCGRPDLAAKALDSHRAKLAKGYFEGVTEFRLVEVN